MELFSKFSSQHLQICSFFDDEEDIRNSLKRFLLFKGFNVDTAENGKDGLEKLEKKNYHIVISDIMMPIMNGIDFLREIGRNYPMVSVIMITGYVTVDNLLACMRLGASNCIYKPLTDLTELEDEINRIIGINENWKIKLNKLMEIKNEL